MSNLMLAATLSQLPHLQKLTLKGTDLSGQINVQLLANSTPGLTDLTLYLVGLIECNISEDSWPNLVSLTFGPGLEQDCVLLVPLASKLKHLELVGVWFSSVNLPCLLAPMSLNSLALTSGTNAIT
jgi:hypothetical protein